MRRSSLVSPLLSLGSFLLLTGCGTSLPHTAVSASPAATFSGRVHGGQQPVTGATIQLYTVGTNGDGSPATPLIAGVVHTDANGNFNITGTYTCTAATHVYLLATGGNPGLNAPNPNLALMTALGPCTNLTPFTYISVNELTTVAAVYSLSQFMSSATHVGASPTNTAALHGAFTLSGQIVDPSTGTLQTNSGTPAAAAQVNTLADILAACVNTTGGTAGDPSTCGRLFSLTTVPAGTAPYDTIGALLNMATYPTWNVNLLYQLTPSFAPYQPTVPTLPPDLSLPKTPSANAASNLQIGPSTLTFPSTSLGVTAPSQTIVITNPTSAGIAITGLTLTGANPADFAETTTCGATLAASASCTVTVTFTPQGSSVRSASLSVASPTPDSPQTVALAGNSTGVVLNGPHAVVDNAIVRIYPGASYDVNLSNTGNAPLAIASIALGNTPFNTQTNTCPSSLDPGASCTISIHSMASGADQLTILTNDQSFSSNILIFPAPNAPAAVFTPSNVVFTDTAIAATSRMGYSYNPAATVTPMVSGPQASEFTVTTPVCTPGNYPMTAPACRFGITFTPAAAGLRFAKVALDASGNYIPLAGMGTSASRVSRLTVGTFFDYFPYPQTLFVTNTGAGALPLKSIGIQTLIGASEYTQVNTCGASLAASSGCTITVTPTRRTKGGTQALLTISTGSDVYTALLTDSQYPVIDLGETSYGPAGTTPRASYPILDGFNTNGYSNLFEVSIADGSWGSFSFAQCSTLSGTCVGELNFSPTQPGLQVGTNTLASSGNTYTGAPNTLVRQYILMGTGVATEPAAKLLLKQAGFTSLVGSNTYSPDTLTLINIGAHAVNISGPTLSGASPEKFTLGQASCLQSSGTNSVYPSIAPGAMCTIPITFNSTQTGFTTATATVTDTVSGLTFTTPLYLDTLVGPSVAPSSLTFPGTFVNTVSASQSVTVTRDITHPVTAVASGGLVATKGSCAAGESPCILTFVFAPTTTSQSPAVAITDTTLGSVTDLGITGTALRPVVHSSVLASPGYLNFGNQTAGTSSLSQTITLTSGGPDPLSLYSFTLYNGNASEFTQTNNCPSSLPMNASCTLTISFVPRTPGHKSDDLTINASSNTGTPLTISLYGTAQ